MLATSTSAASVLAQNVTGSVKNATNSTAGAAVKNATSKMAGAAAGAAGAAGAAAKNATSAAGAAAHNATSNNTSSNPLAKIGKALSRLFGAH